MAETPEQRRVPLGIIGLAFAATVILAVTADPWTYDHALFDAAFDHHKYVHMAGHGIFDLHIAPFGWRVVTPLLARALPFDLQTSFYLISFAAVFLTGVVMYRLAGAFGFSPPLSLAGMLLFFSTGLAGKWLLTDFWLTDPLAFFLITLCVLFAVTARGPAFALTLLLAAAVKESALLVAPVYLTFNWRRGGVGRSLAAGALVALPAALLLAGLRLLFPPMNEDPAYVASLPANVVRAHDVVEYSYVSLPGRTVAYRVERLDSIRDAYSYTLQPLGISVTILAVLGALAVPAVFFRFLPFLLLAYAQLLFTFVDTARLLVLLFPAGILLALSGAAWLVRRARVPPGRFVVVGALLFGLLAGGGREVTPAWLQLLSLPLVALLMTWNRSSSADSPAEGRPLAPPGPSTEEARTVAGLE
jgi:hypothetical protein